MRIHIIFTAVMSALLLVSCANSEQTEPKVRKAVFVIIDGVPVDMVERLDLPAIQDIAAHGSYGHGYVGGITGRYDECTTVSTVGYQNLLTGTWENKHNVLISDYMHPNHNYWTIFQAAKAQDHDVTTGLFSSWLDNRTVLIGASKPETDSLKIDYVFDGYESDTETFPHKKHELQIFDIDEHVSKMAAKCIREDAPDVSWVYLWYTDDAGHFLGNGKFFDDAVRMADRQIGRVWDAVKYREENFNEDWMIVATTDHGRTFDGYGHTWQSERERNTWVATNKKVNQRMTSGRSAIVDIMPSICRFLGIEIPQERRWELDGVPFIGDVDIMDMDAMPYDSTAVLTWTCIDDKADVDVYAAVSNKFMEGGHDEYVKVGTVPASAEKYSVDLTKLPKTDFYKFVLDAPDNSLNRWYKVYTTKNTWDRFPVEDYSE